MDVPHPATDDTALQLVQSRLDTLLPEEYQGASDEREPAPMRSAGLKYRTDGRVAWDRIWGSFCDLAMAGGPPHKGALLEPGRPSDVEAHPDRYDEVAEEICRGVRMAADLDAEPSPDPGWVRVLGLTEPMAGWLLRAITMENVAVRATGRLLDLPASPHYRLEKEIKNVVTVIAKTSHYWLGHMPREQHQAIAALFAAMSQESPLVAPDLDFAPDGGRERLADAMAASIEAGTGLRRGGPSYGGWLGVECPDVRAAVWMMRALVAMNVLSRREGTRLFVPVHPGIDADGAIVGRAMASVHRMARAKSLL